MPSPFESALLNLQLFDLRREAVLREAREWFLREFNPESFAELVEMVSGEPEFCKHLEDVVLGAADAEAILVQRLAATRAAAKARRSELANRALAADGA
jgi:hypothetical protein